MQQTGPPLEIRTLGAVAASRHGRDLAIGGPQPRLLLAFLVHAREHEVGRADLLEALWAGRPPARPDAGLRALVSKLRSALGVSLLEGHLPARVRIPEGVLVDVAAMEEAVSAAEAALAAAAPALALQRAREALELDRGPFAAGLEAEWLEEARREQQATRERALEVAARAAARAAAHGAAGAVAPEARRWGLQAAAQLCQAQPYSEAAHLLWIRLLAGGGDRAQALAVYDELRRRLREELGLVPGAELRAVHRELVAEDSDDVRPALSVRDRRNADSAPPLPAALAQVFGAGPARGRDGPLAEIGRQREAAARSGRLLLISGEAGVGKTSLTAAAAATAHAAGATVLYGRCEPDPLQPFSPFTEALTEPAAAGRLAGLPEWARAYLALLLPGMDGDAGAASVEGEFAQLRLFAAVAAAVVALRHAPEPVVLVLDDLHWADASSLLLLRYLAAEAPRLPLLVLGTMRDPDPDLGELLPATLTILRRRSPLRTIRLAGLTASTVREVISAWAGAAAPPSLAAELTDHTRGNPFYLTAMLQHLRATHALEPGALPARLPPDALQTAPETVRDMVAASVGRLGQPAAAVLDAAAILGPQFAVAEAAEIGGVAETEALRALESAQAAGLTRELGDGTYGFAHALVRTALLERLGATRRAHLHMRAGEAIERDREADRRVGELALHFGRALAHEVAPRVLRYARAAGDRAARRYAFAEAAEHYELALRAWAASHEQSPELRYQLLMALGGARYRSVGPGPAAEPFAEALRLAVAAGDPERMALAALGPGLERYLRTAGGVDAETVAALEQADAALGDGDTRLKARIATQLLLERTFLDPLDQRAQRSARLAALVERRGDAVSRLEAFVARAVALWHPRHTEELLVALPEMLELAARLDRPDLALHLNCTAFGWALELGLPGELAARLAAAAEAAERLRAPVHRLRVRALEITRALLRGELGSAEGQMGGLLAEAREQFPEVATEVELTWSLVLARERGGAERLAPMLDAALAAVPSPGLRAMTAEVCLLCGDVKGARRHLAILGEGGFADIREDFLTLGILSIAGSVAASVEDLERAEVIRDRLRPWAGRNVILGLAAFHRPVALTLGVLEGALGDGRRALSLLRSAEDAAAVMGAPGWQADALCEQGRVLAEVGSVGAAGEAWGRAAEIAGGYGGTLLVRRASEGAVRRVA